MRFAMPDRLLGRPRHDRSRRSRPGTVSATARPAARLETASATCLASDRFQVMKMARASGSCSAWAMRSAAIHAGRPPPATMTISVGSGVEVDRAVGRDVRLGGRDVAVAGPDDLVHPWNRRGPVRQRGDGVSAADAKQPRDAGFERRRHDRWLRPRADGDDLADAGDTGRDRGHQQRRGKREAAAGHVAADACQWFHPLLDRHTRRHHDSQRPRQLPPCDPRDVSCRVADRAPHVGRDARRGVAHLVAGDFERPPDAIEPGGKPAERAIATLPHAIDDAVDAADEGAVLAAARPRAADRQLVYRWRR